MEGFEEVSSVEFRPEKDYFTIIYNSSEPLTNQFAEAIIKQVVVRGVRKALGSVGDSLKI